MTFRMDSMTEEARTRTTYADEPAYPTPVPAAAPAQYAAPPVPQTYPSPDPSAVSFSFLKIYSDLPKNLQIQHKNEAFQLNTCSNDCLFNLIHFIHFCFISFTEMRTKFDRRVFTNCNKRALFSIILRT